MNAHMMMRSTGPTYCWCGVLYFSGGDESQSVGLLGAWALTEQGEAKLTREELAETAGLSLRAVIDLERGAPGVQGAYPRSLAVATDLTADRLSSATITATPSAPRIISSSICLR